MDLEKLAAEFDRAAERHPGYVTVFDFGKEKRSEGGGIHFGGIDKAAMLDLATLWRKAQPHLPEARVNPQTHDDGALDWLAARGRWDAELNHAEQREINPFREIATCLRLEVKDGKSDAEAGRVPMATAVVLLGEVPAMNNAKPPAAAPVAGETLQRDLKLAGSVMDTNAAKIFQIARGGGSAESKMFAIVEIDATYWGRNSPQWAELLDVTESAVKKTNFWRIARPKYFADYRAVWRERHPDDELPDELKKYDRESQD